MLVVREGPEPDVAGPHPPPPPRCLPHQGLDAAYEGEFREKPQAVLRLPRPLEEDERLPVRLPWRQRVMGTSRR